MKKIFSVFGILAFTIISIYAQSNSSLLNREKSGSKFGGFGETTLLTTPQNTGLKLNIGGGGGLIYNDFHFGIFGVHQQLNTPLVSQSVNVLEEEIDLRYGGLLLGYSFKDNWLLHPYFGLRSGLGTLQMQDKKAPSVMLMRESMIVLTPEVGLEFNVTKWMRISGTVGYRWLSEFDNRKLSNNDYSGVIGNISFRFGFF
jgi:hypothetical protein